jgi:large subunit ribosomal protein L18
MIKKPTRNEMRIVRHKRIRDKVNGTVEIPRLCVFRSNKYIYAQIIDDQRATTLASASSLDKDLKLTNTCNIEAAKAVGEKIAEIAKKKKIMKVVFDRGGYLYHGNVKALAEAARNKGLEF